MGSISILISLRKDSIIVDTIILSSVKLNRNNTTIFGRLYTGRRYTERDRDATSNHGMFCPAGRSQQSDERPCSGQNRSQRNQCLKVPGKYFSQYKFRIIFIEKVIRRVIDIFYRQQDANIVGVKNGYLEINIQILRFCTKTFSTHSRQKLLRKRIERNGSRNQTRSPTRSFGPFEVQNCTSTSDV